MNIQLAIAEAIIEESLKAVYKAFDLIDRSFLTAEAKNKYNEIVGERHRFLQMK